MTSPPTSPPPAKVTSGSPQDLLNHSLENAELLDRKGYAYLVHPLLDGVPRCEAALLQAWVDWAASQAEVAGATLLVAPEAMGLPLVAGLSLATGLPYAIIRKRKYDMPGEEIAYCETGYGQSCLHINDCWPEDKVLLVDDVLSTGATIDSLLGTFESMKVTVVGVLVVIDKGIARQGLVERHKVPIRAMRTVKIVGKKVEIVR